MKREHFFGNMGSILVYAFVGTPIATFITAGLVYILTLFHWVSLTGLECLIFGALISATDPVSTLSVFSSLGVDKNLYANVFGESVMNDAIAIVLFRTLLTFIKKDFTTLSFFLAILDFLKIFFGSIGIALIVGVFSALLTKHTNFSKYPTLELILIIQYAFASYLIAEGLLLSGIVTVLFVGMFMGHYTSHNLSTKGNLVSKKFFHTIAVIAESFVFTYLGMAIFSYERSKHYFDVGLIVLSIPIILLARAFNIFPLTFLINCWRTPDKKIQLNTQIMMWFAGLRGAIAFVLALMVPTIAKAEMLTTTLIIVVFTVLIFGGLTVPLLKLLNIEMHEEGETRVINNKGSNRFWVFDRAFILPFLTNKQKLEIKLDEELPNDSSSII